MVEASESMQKYFDSIKSTVQQNFDIAKEARAKGFDPTTQVDVQLAKNLAERVVGLIAIVAPNIVGSGAVERILELEQEYGSQDWRVGMQIALEIAEQKFAKFDNPLEAIETGVRTGFAYVTVGVVSAPLEGFTNIEIKKRRDGKEYFALRYAGPIRNAGGTAAAVSVLIADYVRNKLGYAKYDADEKEVNRTYTELMDYHDKVTNLQYVPSEAESNYLVQNIPVEVDGDPSEKWDVSNYKDLPRIATNRIRSGVCLIHSSCIPLKAKKLWKNLSKWIDEMDMQDWAFLKEFLDIQQKATSRSDDSAQDDAKPKTQEEKYIVPNYTYITDLVGGRPVISHPLRRGGLRLRYGRCPTSGFSAQAIHPATMAVLDDFVAIGTQFKVERPGKAAAFTSCDTIEGPIVELHNGNVMQLNSYEKAKEVAPEVKRILYLGDVLINYGDFYDRAHTLLPPGYCEEWWVKELKQKVDDPQQLAKGIDISKEEAQKILNLPLDHKPTASQAVKISKVYDIPLHPQFTAHWKQLSPEQVILFVKKLQGAKQVKQDEQTLKTVILFDTQVKEILNILGIAHEQAGEEFLVLKKNWSTALEAIFGAYDKVEHPLPTDEKNGLEFMQKFIKIPLRDKSGVFIGARMGRPEKAKMRKIAGHPWSVAPQQETVVEGGFEKTNIITEHNMKAQLRERFQIHSNKDGTIRYDGSEVPITHFRPNEIGATVEKLLELGYEKDIKGNPLTDENQIVELFPQDIVIPCCEVSPNEPCDLVLYRTACFVDELLVELYGMEPYYNLESKSDLIGHLVFGLAPHTSAASVGRIVGFTKSQGMFCHPMFHAAMRRDCDGDETCIFLLMDGLLNFSTKYLPKHRGGTMDAPLVLTSIINPQEVDDMVFNMDIAWEYPLEFYQACLEFKKPWDVKVPIFEKTLGTPQQFEGMGFTHHSTNMNDGILCSAYKTLPSMKTKVDGSMAVAVKIDAVDEADMAEIVIKKHFLRDINGNLRKFSMQEFRCGKCNTKYRRPPLSGRCPCGNPKLIFTISQASVVKYLAMSIELGEKYAISPYTQQILQVLQLKVDQVFGKEKETQTGLNEFFG